MQIEFQVQGKPPKKDGANSMWNKESEALRIIALREGAWKAMQEAGMRDCFRSHVEMEIDLFVPRSQIEQIGDLDNFITGICDGLQAADPKAKLHSLFNNVAPEIHPSRALLIQNDSKVISITAKKISQDDNLPIYYNVKLGEVAN